MDAPMFPLSPFALPPPGSMAHMFELQDGYHDSTYRKQ
jgi:hypothetical protein